MTSSTPKSPDFITDYLRYVGRSESPVAFHRWSAIGGIGAMLGKSVWFEHGSFKVYPNMYIQLFGEAGVRKSTSIKLFSKMLRAAGFKDFAAEKTSKEKFIEWMAERASMDTGIELFEDLNGDDCNVLIAADEFNDFFSTNILDFLSFLGVMWDYEGNYEHSTRSGGTVVISNPCLSILSGNTPTTLAKTIPPEAIGQGFFSRTLAIYSEPTGIKIAFPDKPDEEETVRLAEELASLKDVVTGPIETSPDARTFMELIYHKWKGISDPRFGGYGNRRFNQLIKLSIIHAIAAKSPVIEVEHVLRANTVLTRAEREMPKALGEFGISRNAAVSSKIISILDKVTSPAPVETLWGYVQQDFDRYEQFTELLRGLVTANKIVWADTGFLPVKIVHEVDTDENITVDWTYLSKQEREYVSNGPAN